MVTKTGSQVCSGIKRDNGSVLVYWISGLGSCLNELKDMEDLFNRTSHDNTVEYANSDNDFINILKKYPANKQILDDSNDLGIGKESTVQEVSKKTNTVKRKWTGGHKPSGALPDQKESIPTPDEQISIADCVD